MQGNDLAQGRAEPAKKMADTKRVKEGISPELYEELRKKTPSAEIQKKVNDVPFNKKVDPVYGHKVKTLEADHIVPMKKITEMQGFNQLSKDNQVKVLNDPENFMGLGRKSNASKGSKSWSEWQGHPDLGPVPPRLRSRMIRKEKTLEARIHRRIGALNRWQ
jgi:hypothetical protein